MKTRQIRIILAVGVVLVAAALSGHGGEMSGPMSAKTTGKTGNRLVGVACICYPPRASEAEMKQWIDKAALDKPDIILLTEGFMHNTDRTASRQEKDDKSEPLPKFGPITTLLASKAKQHNTYIIGCYWRKAEEGRGRYNSAVLLDRQGKLVGIYDKVFPTINEMQGGVVPGRRAVVFETDFGRIGALICFDLNFPELLAEYKKLDVDLLCFLSNFRGGSMVPSTAFANQCFIATSVPGENAVIVDPLGRVLAESSHYGRIIFARINLDSQIVHIDNNVQRVARLKEKYGPQVQIETASPEGVYFLSSLHPDKRIYEMIKEFEIETLDTYLDHTREIRKERLVDEKPIAEKWTRPGLRSPPAALDRRLAPL